MHYVSGILCAIATGFAGFAFVGVFLANDLARLNGPRQTFALLALLVLVLAGMAAAFRFGSRHRS